MEKTGINKRVLIIIPCYNEAENVPGLAAELKNLKIEHCSLQPLFINDSSTDNTREVLDEMKLPYLDNPVNLGIGGTVQLGLMYASENNFDIAVQMDGDGQHPPSELHKIIRPVLLEESDVVIGSRFIDNAGYRSTFLRRIGISFFCKLNDFLVGLRITDPTSGYRAYNRTAILKLVDYYPDEYPEPETIVYLANLKIKIREVAVNMLERESGKSSIRKFTTLYYMAKVSLNILFLHLKMKFNG